MIESKLGLDLLFIAKIGLTSTVPNSRAIPTVAIVETL